MRIFLDANVLLDCLVLEATGEPRAGKAASDQVLSLCDLGVHQGLVAWHTLPIVAYYHSRQNPTECTAEMMDGLLSILEVPSVSHQDAKEWRRFGMVDFEDSLQVACAMAGRVDVIITRNVLDFTTSVLPIKTPEQFLRDLA